MAVAAERTTAARRAVARRGARAGARAQPRPAAPHASSTTARRRSRLPQAARGAGPAFLLESAEQGQRVGRYSFIGFRPAHGRCAGRWATPAIPTRSAAAEVARHARRRCPTLPPFAGGAVGFFGYDLVRTVEPLGAPNPDVLGLPDMALMLTDVLVVFDHLKHTVTVLANVYAEEATWSAPTPRRWRRSPTCATAWPGRSRAPPPLAGARRCPSSRSNMPREQFEAMVARIVEYIHAGDAFQVVPSPALVGARCRSRRSRSTAACARSTRARTCTSWTSATSRSPAPSPSRCSPSPAGASRRGRSPARARAAASAEDDARIARRSCSPTRRSAPST